jgi:phosphotriesterase-related protein
MTTNVQTVLGPVISESLGVTLMHEHLLMSFASWHHPPKTASRMNLRNAPVSLSILGELRMDPFVNLDNLQQYDVDLAAREVQQFADLGGRTVLDPTNRGIGRDPQALAAISRRTGLNVIMGSGYYLGTSHSPAVKQMNSDDIAAEIERDLTEGVDETGVRAGFIGEIGVSARFTPEEEKVLRGAARAQRGGRVPLMVHLPGWERLAHRVLDVIAEEGTPLQPVILCHMGPSWRDFDYQVGLAERGAYLEYDMISMDYYYADQDAQCPSDEENAAAIQHLINSGFRDRLLISQDVFLKMMLTSYGGFGYGYILRHFVPRLRRLGVSEDDIRTILVDNPRRAFEIAGGQRNAGNEAAKDR